MKLYETPKTFADLEKGDIVYAVVNGQVMEVKLVDYTTIYDLGINENLTIGSKSVYHFVTADGTKIVVDYDAFRDYKVPRFYATLDLLRDNGFHTYIKWDYGCPSSYYNNKENMDARERFINTIKSKYDLEFTGKYCFRLYFISAKTKQITELNFPTFTDNGDGDLEISHCGHHYGDIYDLLDSGRFYRTRQECQMGYKPKVVRFNNTEKKKVYCVFIEKNWVSEEYSDVTNIFDNEKSAISALQDLKNDFAEEIADKWGEDIFNDENYEITDEPKHFQCLDENNGYNFEVWVFEKEIEQ